MTRDDIISMARDAGLTGLVEADVIGNFERFAALVAAVEREECAKVCDDEATIEGVAQRCAQAIRARGDV
jgi:hypothetical protein